MLITGKQTNNFYLSHWPNRQSIINCVLVTANIALEASGSSFLKTAGVNMLFRLISYRQTAFIQRNYKIGMDIFALGVLYHPYGRLICVGLDTVLEVYNFYHRPIEKKNNTNLSKGLDPNDYSSALKLLCISEENPSEKVIKEQLDKTIKVLERKKLRVSKPIAKKIQSMIDKHNQAYATLTGGK